MVDAHRRLKRIVEVLKKAEESYERRLALCRFDIAEVKRRASERIHAIDDMPLWERSGFVSFHTKSLMDEKVELVRLRSLESQLVTDLMVTRRRLASTSRSLREEENESRSKRMRKEDELMSRKTFRLKI